MWSLHKVRLPKWRVHKCPPDVEITVMINGRPIVGPITGESLALISKYGGGGGFVDTEWLRTYVGYQQVDFKLKYIKR